MELKQSYAAIRLLPEPTINRTIMELKLLILKIGNFLTSSINRTIMELKLRYNQAIFQVVTLLIEPLWN